METIKNYIIFILTVIIMLFLLFSKRKNNKDIKIEEKIIIKETHDTIRPKPIIIYLPEVNNIKPKKEIKIINIDSTLCNTQRYYQDSISDTNQTIYYDIVTTGKLDNLKIGYKLKVPLIINNYKEVIISKNIIKPPKFSLYGGISTIGNINGLDIAPYVNINIGNKNIMYGYHILNKQHQIGISIKLFSSRK